MPLAQTEFETVSLLFLLLKILFWALVVTLVTVTAVPLSRRPHGAIRTLAFPRLQVVALALVLAAVAPALHGGIWLWIGWAILLGVVAVQAWKIAPFTPIWRAQSLRPDAELRTDTDRHVRIIAANVKQSNENYRSLIDVVRHESPDIVIAVETDDGWAEALRELKPLYSECVERPYSNTYGMILYSRFRLEDCEVRELLVKEVPSIRTTVVLPSGDRFRLYAVHPEPPIPNMETTGRDAEIGLVGIEAGEDSLPAVVTGDLNDVAWSFTTRRFQRLSGLLDPRVGRGFYNSFDARYFFLRWPLDHLFHDARFRLLEMRRLPKIGSDHFPMLFGLALARTEAQDADPGETDAEEKREVEEMGREEKRTDREAIGHDWED